VRVVAATGEEPGKIPHEERELAPDWMLAAGYPVRPDRSCRSYQSVDATPLFLVFAAMAGFTGPAVAEALAWPDGRGVDPPVAVASAQAFTYAALRGHGRHEAAAALADRLDPYAHPLRGRLAVRELVRMGRPAGRRRRAGRGPGP
jgi:hypothetical protein